ncbi:MAG: S1/P1 nuclease [Bacteroidales bacterium]|jgi:hypothetical protein|nr:S1/P1 nuclease [Bacteroidales bacterium]
MIKKIGILLVGIIICLPNTLFAWGQSGHNAVAYIAECNLTKKAKKNIEKYSGHSIVYYSVWMDNYRATPSYAHTTVWHTAAVDEHLQYTEAVRSSKGDVVCELENAIKALQGYKNLEDSLVVLNLKYVIHMVGDMHCPVHVKYPGIKNFNVKLNGTQYSYHAVWDSQIIDRYRKWGYMEWAHQLDRCTKKEIKEMASGTPREWFHQTAVDCRVIYEWASPNEELGKDFLNVAIFLAESQILKAGYRLAGVLNLLFG